MLVVDIVFAGMAIGGYAGVACMVVDGKPFVNEFKDCLAVMRFELAECSSMDGPIDVVGFVGPVVFLVVIFSSILGGMCLSHGHCRIG